MKNAVLDTNFILSCVKQKIDFFEEICFKGMKILIPEEVINEIKKIAISGKRLHYRRNAELALKVLEKNNFETIQFRSSNVDKSLIEYSKANKNAVIATLDSALKGKIKKPQLVIRKGKRLEII